MQFRACCSICESLDWNRTNEYICESKDCSTGLMHAEVETVSPKPSSISNNLSCAVYRKLIIPFLYVECIYLSYHFCAIFHNFQLSFSCDFLQIALCFGDPTFYIVEIRKLSNWQMEEFTYPFHPPNRWTTLVVLCIRHSMDAHSAANWEMKWTPYPCTLGLVRFADNTPSRTIALVRPLATNSQNQK